MLAQNVGATAVSVNNPGASGGKRDGTGDGCHNGPTLERLFRGYPLMETTNAD
jgi:hypothetical protein